MTFPRNGCKGRSIFLKINEILVCFSMILFYGMQDFTLIIVFMLRERKLEKRMWIEPLCWGRSFGFSIVSFPIVTVERTLFRFSKSLSSRFLLKESIVELEHAYYCIFQVPKEQLLISVPLLINYLQAESIVVHTYAAHALERLFTMRGPNHATL